MNIVDYFVHPSLRNEPDTYNRARILATSIVALALSALLALIAILLSGFPRQSNILASILILPAVSCFIVALFRLRKEGNDRFASMSTLIVMLAIMVGGICVSGGPQASPALQLLIIPPLAAYFFGGRPMGRSIIFITLLIVIMLTTLDHFHITFPQTVESPDKLTILNFVVTFLNLSVISLMAFIYEYTANLLKQERNLEHQKFVQLAKTDPLTGLANRRNFDALLAERISIHGHPSLPQRFALGYLDLDGFKPINDRHGHAVGDEVLRVISDRLRSTLRGSDFVGRHGGDEFMLMIDLPDGQDFLELMADRLLTAIAQPINTSAGILSVTGSLGFAIFPLDANEIEALKKSADSAMYAAKHQRGSWRYFHSTHTASAA